MNSGTNHNERQAMKAIEVERQEIVEWYIHCPKCQLLISDGIGNQVEHDSELMDKDIVVCSCGTRIKIKA